MRTSTSSTHWQPNRDRALLKPSKSQQQSPAVWELPTRSLRSGQAPTRPMRARPFPTASCKKLKRGYTTNGVRSRNSTKAQLDGMAEHAAESVGIARHAHRICPGRRIGNQPIPKAFMGRTTCRCLAD